MSELDTFSDSDLLSELHARGHIVSAWCAEDGEGPVEEEFPDETDERKKLLAAAGVDLTAPQLKALIASLSERDDAAPVVTDAKGKPVPDTDARDTENVPLGEDIHSYFAREVLPHVPDAWIDESKTKVGYEIPFTRRFYKYVPPRPLVEIDADLNKLVREITELLNEVEA